MLIIKAKKLHGAAELEIILCGCDLGKTDIINF